MVASGPASPSSRRRDYWNSVDDYAGEIASLWHLDRAGIITSAISAHRRGDSAADLGCGPGYWLACLDEAPRLFAVDFAEGLLEQARGRAPAQTEFLCQNLAALDLPAPVDFALCLNAIMPESHTHALQIFERVFTSLAPGGRLILVLPSIEAMLYAANMMHFAASEDGKESESLTERMEIWAEWYSNPLGYVRNSNDMVVKYWLRPEAEEVFSMTGDVAVLSRFRVAHRRLATGETLDARFRPPWFWGWVLEKAERG